MEENKLIKYNKGLVEHISDVIGITNKLLKKSSILKTDTQIAKQEDNDKLKAMLLIKKQVMQARKWKKEQLNSFNFIGENKKHIVILINEFSEEYIQPSSMKYLLMILKACKLELADVAIINIGKQKTELKKIMTLFLPNAIILFGIKSIDLSSTINLNLNQIFTYENCKILVAPPLKILFPENSKAWVEKRELWLNLKSVLDL